MRSTSCPQSFLKFQSLAADELKSRMERGGSLFGMTLPGVHFHD